MQQLEYETSIARCNWMGLGLFGSIGLVAAGALKESPEILRHAYFLALFVAFVVIGGSRWYTVWQASKVRRRICEGKLAKEDLVGQSRFPRLYEDYFHFALCMSALFPVGFIALGAPWIKVMASSETLTADLLAKTLDTKEITAVFTTEFLRITLWAVFLIFLFLLYVGDRRQARATEAGVKLLNASICTNSCFNAYDPYLTCAKLIEGTKKTIGRIKRIWVVMVAQVTCLSAGALDSAPVSYYALATTYIAYYAYFLGYGLLVNENAMRRVKYEKNLKRLRRESYPRVAELIELVRFNPHTLWQGLVFPPLVIVCGILHSLAGFPSQVEVALPVFLSAYFFVDFTVRWWISPIRQYDDS